MRALRCRTTRAGWHAALIRLLLVPLLRLMGRWAWYLPRWAHRMLPDVRFGQA
jgi:hypothetical protein